MAGPLAPGSRATRACQWPAAERAQWRRRSVQVGGRRARVQMSRATLEAEAPAAAAGAFKLCKLVTDSDRLASDSDFKLQLHHHDFSVQVPSCF